MAPRLLLPVISSRNVPVAVSPPVPAVSGNGMNEMVLSRYTLSGGFRPAYSELSSEFGGWTGGGHVRFIKLCYGGFAAASGFWGLTYTGAGFFGANCNSLRSDIQICPEKSGPGIRRAGSGGAAFWWGAPVWWGLVELYFFVRVKTLSAAPFLRPLRLAKGLSWAMSRFSTWLIS